MEESNINITTAPVLAGWLFTISDSNNAESPSTSNCINFCVSREEVMSYRGGQNGTVAQPRFHKIIVDGSSNPDNDLCITVKCNEKELFNIEKPKKQFVCQMYYDYKIEKGKICLTTASAFVPDGCENVSDI